MRIGQGYDAHRFAPGRPLILGGVKIKHDLGLAPPNNIVVEGIRGFLAIAGLLCIFYTLMTSRIH